MNINQTKEEYSAATLAEYFGEQDDKNSLAYKVVSELSGHVYDAYNNSSDLNYEQQQYEIKTYLKSKVLDLTNWKDIHALEIICDERFNSPEIVDEDDLVTMVYIAFEPHSYNIIGYSLHGGHKRYNYRNNGT